MWLHSDKAHAELRCLTNPYTARVAWVFWSDFCYFSADFHIRFVARSRKPTKCILKNLFKGCKQWQIFCKANSWSCSFQQWHLRQLACNCLSNSYRIWREMVTAHILVGVQRPRWTVVIYPPDKFLSRNTVTWRPVTGGRQHRTPATLSKAFHEEPGRVLSRGRQNACRQPWHIPGISRKFAEKWTFVCRHLFSRRLAPIKSVFDLCWATVRYAVYRFDFSPEYTILRTGFNTLLKPTKRTIGHRWNS